MTDRRDRDAEGELLSPEEERALAEALENSVRPEPLPEARHEAILARVGLGGATAPEDESLREPDEHEIASARAFTEALETGAPHPDAELARALALAAPSDAARRRGAELALAANERALSRALPAAPRSGSKVLFVTFGAASAALALAASIVLAIGLETHAPEPRPELLLSRSLGPVLGPDAPELSASARLDRIATARSRELRSNRYAAWGVR